MKITLDVQNIENAVSALKYLVQELSGDGEYNLKNQHKLGRCYPITFNNGLGFMFKITKTGYSVRELMCVRNNEWQYSFNPCCHVI